MAFITTTTSGLTVSITKYSINPAKIYISSKEDHGLGNSFVGGDYPYYVDDFVTNAGEVKIDKSYSAGNYIAHLYGSEDDSPYHILDYSTFTLSSCTPNWQCEQPLNGYESDGCGNRRQSSNCNPEYDEVISLVYISQDGDKSHFKCALKGSGTGSLLTRVNNVIIGDSITPIIKNEYDVYFTWTSGIYIVCMGVYNIGVTTKWICAPPVTIGSKWKCTGSPYYDCVQATDGIFLTRDECLASPECTYTPPICTTIPLDTWKPTTLNPKPDMSVPFTLHSKDPNKHFKMMYNQLGGLNVFILEGTTDSAGCYTGSIPSLANGEYNIFICYDLFGICTITTTLETKTIVWGTSDTGCWIPLPLGGCLLSAKTGKTIVYAGAGLTAEYLAYKKNNKK